MIFLLAGIGGASTIACRTIRPATAMGYGSLLLAVGAVATVLTIAAGSAAGFFIATAFTGTGFGLAFLGVFRTLTALAPPTGRAGLITVIYIVSYLAFSVPVIVAGIEVGHVGLRTTSIAYGILVAVLAAVVAAETALPRHLHRPRRPRTRCRCRRGRAARPGLPTSPRATFTRRRTLPA